MSRQEDRTSTGPGDAPRSHTPVMAGEVVEFFAPSRPGLLVDGTAGGGGHLVALLEAFPDASILAVDRDPAAVEALRGSIGPGDRVVLRAASYTLIPDILGEAGLGAADGALFDLGLSSLQLDDPSRGFSHSSNGPLDMRFDRGSGSTAADLVGTLSEKDIADLLWRWGEERRSRQIARAITASRPLASTAELASVVRRVSRGNPVKTVSRVFQALRIAVNCELDELARLLEGLHAWVRPGGGVAFITFHSLEDRMVKHFFRDSPWFSPTRPAWVGPSPEEASGNPRARSAKLRTGVRK